MQFTVDLHAHTRFFHQFEGHPTPLDPIGAQVLALFARRADLDAVALTNHDYYAEFDPIGRGIQFLPGVEISTTAGHVLVVGPDPPSRTAPGELTPAEAVALAHERDCAAIVAHPFRGSSVRESDADFDAVEINGKHPEDSDSVEELATELDLPIVGGSDAHLPFEIGSVYTSVDVPALTADAMVTAIQEGRVEPRVRKTRADGMMRTAYRHVHRYVRQ